MNATQHGQHFNFAGENPILHSILEKAEKRQDGKKTGSRD